LKKILRKKLLNIRKKNYSNINQNHISDIFEFIIKKYRRLNLVGGYIPINYEYDCLSILKFFEKKNYSIALPVIKKDFKMNFYKHSFNEPLKINKLGIPEPYKLSKKVIPDLIFVPLVGYDNNFNRLGYGGGYYDRYFRKISKLKKIHKIGLAFSFQKIKKIPVNNFDKKIDGIITEKKIIL
tara:strand:- start:558 stop:1103 length:546 start_codon:yes stop_codon:yes gene_type:complete